MRRFGLTMAVAAAALLAACGKGDQPAAEPALVEAPSEPAEASPTATTTETPKAPESAATVASAEHAGCAANTAADEADCPFPEEKAAHEGCGDHLAAAEPTHGEDGSLHLGVDFTLDETKPLGKVLDGNGAITDGQKLNVRVSGTIDKVCQKKGCWMVVRDGDVEARVIMKDHAFAVPRDSQGKAAQVEGALTVRVFTEAQAKHLAEDGGEDPSAVTGERKELLLTATAVEIGG